jgi:hypothetical protein
LPVIPNSKNNHGRTPAITGKSGILLKKSELVREAPSEGWLVVKTGIPELAAFPFDTSENLVYNRGAS